MKKNKELYQEVIKFLKKADQNIWEAIMVIDNSNNMEIRTNIEPLMEIRGEIIVEFLFKFYKKYPELEPSYDVDESKVKEMNRMLDSLDHKD